MGSGGLSNPQSSTRQRSALSKSKKTVCRFGVGILAHSQFLIPFGGHVNVEVVKRAGLDLVGVFMAFPVVAAQPEDLVAAGCVNRQDDREVQDV